MPFQTNQTLSLGQLPAIGPRRGSHRWEHKLPMVTETVILQGAWLLVTDITRTHLLSLSAVSAKTPFSSSGQEDASCLTQILKQVTRRCSTTCLSSAHPARPQRILIASLLVYLNQALTTSLALVAFTVLGISKPGSLQLS